MNKTIEIDGKPYTVNLLEIKGKEKYHALTNIFRKMLRLLYMLMT